MKNARKWLSMLLAAALVFALLPQMAAPARAEEPKASGKDLGAYTFDMTEGEVYYPTDDETKDALSDIMVYLILGGGLYEVDTDVYDVNNDGIGDFIKTTDYGDICFQPCDNTPLEGPVEIKLSEEQIQLLENDDMVKAFYSSVVFVFPTLFDLWVAGVQVSTANKNFIGGSSLVRYNPEENELIFAGNKTFTAEQSYNKALIYNAIDGLTVVSSSAYNIYKINTEADYCICSVAPNILFRGDLVLKSAKTCVQAVNVQVTGFTLDVTGAERGIHAKQRLKVLDGTLNAHATGATGSCALLAGSFLELAQYIQVQAPAGGEVKELHYIGEYDWAWTVTESDGTAPAKDVSIYAKGYGLKFDGIMATEANREDVLGNGVFSFDGDHTVTVKGDYHARYANVINNQSIKNLVIRVEEDSILHQDGTGVIGSYQNMTITGPGKLTLWSFASTALWIAGGTMTLEDLFLEVRGSSGISGGYSGGTSDSIVIRNSCVLSETHNDTRAIFNFSGGITLEGCTLMQPADGSIGPMSILDAENKGAGKVVIGTPGFQAYDLFIDEIWVTSRNQDDILGNGIFSYADGTLRISGSYTHNPEHSSGWGYLIDSEIPNMTIYAEKDAELHAKYIVIALGEDSTITGPGHMTLCSKYQGIFVRQGKNVRIYRTELTANSSGSNGIGGYDETSKVIIDGADVTAVGEGQDAYWAMTGVTIELKQTELISPKDGSIGTFHYVTEYDDRYLMSVLDAGGNPAKEAIFAATVPNHTVTFVNNGHGEAPAAQPVKDGMILQAPTSPKEDGWSFEGWYSDKECTSVYGFTAPVTGDLTLYAKWTRSTDPSTGLPCSGGEDCPGKVFTDMPKKDNWAHDAIDWAVVNNITSGTSVTTFSPGNVCTRAQVVTFLWRAAGKPEPTIDKAAAPFTDVPETSYYYTAVLWALEKNITKGLSATKFGPDEGCTRGQVVTFLHRFSGMPEPGSEENPFKDVKAGAFYYQAVLWAVNHDPQITNGTGPTAFSPDLTCTRAQIVTFLYRAMDK